MHCALIWRTDTPALAVIMCGMSLFPVTQAFFSLALTYAYRTTIPSATMHSAVQWQAACRFYNVTMLLVSFDASITPLGPQLVVFAERGLLG